MRISILNILILAGGLQLLMADPGNGQGLEDIPVTIELKNESLLSAFQKIEQQTDYLFAYREEQVNGYRTNLDRATRSLKEVLDTILAGTRLEYHITNNKIIVKRKPLIVPISRITEWAPSALRNKLQTGTITGRVIDAQTGEPLLGASIYIEETSKGIATDKEGNFTLSGLEMGEYTIVATYVGYKDNKKKVLVKDGETVTVNFELELALATMEEVVVTGYYSLPEERATGSFSNIDQEELETINSLSIEDKLQGLVPGLLFEPNFNSDQSPTTERSRGLIVRGQSTLGDNSPLIVVDGFPIISSGGVDPWSTINPDNVKSVTVLKDAAAASIWGAQAANGVIVIETKDAKKTARPSFSASVDYFTQPAPDLYDIPFASSEESVEIFRSLILEGNNFDPLMQSFFKDDYELPEVIDVLVKMKAGEISESAGNQRLNELAQIDVRDEFSNLFFRNMESNTRFNLSYSNGTEYSRTRASVMATNSNEYAIGDSELEVIANIKNEFKPTDWFTTNIGVSYTLSNEKNNGVDIRSLQNIPQMSRIVDADGNYQPMVRYEDDLYYDVKTSMRRGLVDQYNLPYDWDWNLAREMNNRDQTDESNNLRINSKITLTPIDQIAVDLFYQYERNHSLVSEYYNEESWYVRNTVNKNARPDGSFPVPAGGMLYENQSNSTSHNGRVQVTYDDTFFEDHSLRVLGGIEIRKDYYEDIPYGYYGYDPQSLTHISNINFEDEVNPKLTGEDDFRGAIPPIPTVHNTSIFIDGRDDRFLSYYGNLGYSYDQRYDLTGSIRLDQTNLYGRAPSYRALPQWSIGAGWTISDESFYNIQSLDYLKLRVSYGWNGHIDKSASPFIKGTPWVDPVNQLEYASVQSTPNPGLTWEKTANYNIGLDFAVWDDRLEGTIEAYQKKSRDVLSDVEVNPTYGFYSDEATLNNGNITNKGIEVALSSSVVDKEIQWQTGFNFSFNKNVARNVQTSTGTIADWAGLSQFNPVNGQPVDYIAVAEWAGYSNEGLPQVYYDGEIQDVTEINYSNADLEKLYNFVGRRSPKYFGSWSNTFSYNNFEFSFRLLYRFGHKFFKDTPPRNALSDYTSFSNFFTFNSDLLVNRWQSEADSETASMYSVKNDVNFLTSLTTGYLAKYNTSNLLDAGNVRLKNISFSYNLPPNFLGAIKRGQIQIQARNLGPIFLKNDEGLDPDFPKYSSSLYSAYYNIIRDRPTYSINLSIGI